MTLGKLIRAVLCLFVLSFFFLLFITPDQVSAQQKAFYGRKYHFSGLIELTYRDYSTKTIHDGNKTESNWSAFEQRYKLGLSGFIYHPRLLLFSTSVSFINEEIKDDLSGRNKGISYDLSASLLPQRPVSLNIFAMRATSRIEGWGASPYEVTSNTYGASLFVTQRKLPVTIISYNHWDYTQDRDQIEKVTNIFGQSVYQRKRVEEKIEFDGVDFRITGALKSPKLNYSLGGNFFEYSNPYRTYTGQNLRSTIDVHIKKDTTLSTYFHYSNIDISTLTNIGVLLKLSPLGRFHHSYGYDFLTSETGRGGITNFHNVTALWNYRFNTWFRGKADLRYRFGDRNGEHEELYDTAMNLDYKRPIKSLDFLSSYGFSYANKLNQGDYKMVDHTFGLGLATRQLRAGKIYSNYNFSYKTYDAAYTIPDKPDKTAHFDSREHKLKTGVTGKGFGRMYWTVEAEGRYSNLTNGVGGSEISFWSTESQWAQNIRDYTMSGEVRYPIRGKGDTTFKSSYTTGKINSNEIQKYSYEGRLQYHIFKNLSFSAWWREEWWSKGWYSWYGPDERVYGTKNREYQIETYYRLGSTSFSIEYNVSKIITSSSSEYKRLYMKLSRPI
ncbi:MAG: hypothetical protein FJ241_03710 [Nitrospira sp.]|nr:hypothetical protein [Nitrospira sp.]